MNFSPYHQAQAAMADLKGAVYQVLSEAKNGMTNAAIGRALGIYVGHVRHEGHISRTILAMMESEGVVEQDKETKTWFLNN